MAHIIGIGGVSRSGKSTLARRLKEKLKHRKALLIDMDEYVLPESELPKIKGHADYEVPESIDYDRIIALLKTSDSVYEIIIVEGILAFANEKLNQLYDMTICMEISKSTYLDRRKVETRWGKDPSWYLEHVWDAHQKFGLCPHADFVFSGEEEVTEDDLSNILIKIS
jgi:uridine kinase